MDELLDMLADDSLSITYRPKIAKGLGSITRALLFQQVLYRWKNKGRKAFYKFKEPCKHPLYKDGDSWVEELGFSRREFDSALDSIAQKISAGVERNPAKLIWYWTDSSRVTYYELNYEAACLFVKSLYVTAESAVSKSAKAPLLLTEITPEITSDIPSAETGVSAPVLGPEYSKPHPDLLPRETTPEEYDAWIKATTTPHQIQPSTAEEILTVNQKLSAEERKKKVKLAFPTLEELEAQIDGWWQSWDLWKTTVLPKKNETKTISHAALATILADLLEKQNRYDLSAAAMREGLSAAMRGDGKTSVNYVITVAREYKG